MNDKDNYQYALSEAKKGRAAGGIPIGGALVVDGKVIAVGHNQRVQHGSAIHHAEMNCLENAGRLPASVYQKATMYTTLSPCDMCTGAMLLYKIPRVVIGENRTFLGGEALLKSRGVEVIDHIINGQEVKKHVALIRDLSDTMLNGSLCALGGMTPYPVLSALNHFPKDFGVDAKELKA